MKSKDRFKQKNADAAARGLLSAEDIVRTDWERNYAKKTDIELQDLRLIVKQHVDDGGAVFRLRNTLFLVNPEDGGYARVKFHTLTADSREVYGTMLVLFFLGLNKDQGTEIAYTYVPDKSIQKFAKRLFGASVAFEDVKDDPEADAPLKLTIDISSFAKSAEAKQAARS